MLNVIIKNPVVNPIKAINPTHIDQNTDIQSHIINLSNFNVTNNEQIIKYILSI